MSSLWITSMDVFAPLYMPVLEQVQAQRIAEIGAAEGGNTRLLAEFLQARHGTLITMDPAPRGTFLQWVQSMQGTVQHLMDYSLNCIPQAGAVDAWFVDGDHNWYTVLNELLQIDALAIRHHKPALIFMHDVGWPCARRDMYYNPATIPKQFVQPNSNQLGLNLDKHSIAHGALIGPYWALEEGGARNGVMTAVEDFIAQCHARYAWFYVPAILGFGVLVDITHAHAQAIADYFQPYHNNPLMAAVEHNRIQQYLAAHQAEQKLKAIAQFAHVD